VAPLIDRRLALDRILHRRDLLGRMALPFLDFAGDAQRLARAIGLGRVAGKARVGEVGVVHDLAGRLDGIDAPAPFACRQFRAPRRRVQGGGQVHITQLGPIVDGMAGPDQVARFQLGPGAVIENLGEVNF